MTLELLEARCDGLEYGWIYLEGDPVPVVLTLLGRMPIVVQFADTLPTTPIYRITSNSRFARTLDGVGPGVKLLAVAELWPDLRIAFGEGIFALSEAHPGISLEVDMAGDWEAAERVRRTGDWSALPEGSFVASVALVGTYHGHRKD